MAWTYDPNNLSSSPRDALRFKIGDTVESRPLLSDEELDYLLDLYDDNIAVSAWRAAESAAMVLGGKADKTVGRLSISYSRQSEAFAALAKRLKREATAIGAPLAGGMGPTVLDKENGKHRTDYSTSSANIAPPPDPPTYVSI